MYDREQLDADLLRMVDAGAMYAVPNGDEIVYVSAEHANDWDRAHALTGEELWKWQAQERLLHKTGPRYRRVL